MLRTQIENPSVRSRAVLDFMVSPAYLCPTHLGRPSTRGAKTFTLAVLEWKTYIPLRIWVIFESNIIRLAAGGEPSTWFPPERLVGTTADSK